MATAESSARPRVPRHWLAAAGVLGALALAAVAVLVQRSDAAHFLYPLVETWPIPTDTAETFLVRPDGNAALVEVEVEARLSSNPRRRQRLTSPAAG